MPHDDDYEICLLGILYLFGDRCKDLHVHQWGLVFWIEITAYFLLHKAGIRDNWALPLYNENYQKQGT